LLVASLRTIVTGISMAAAFAFAMPLSGASAQELLPTAIGADVAISNLGAMVPALSPVRTDVLGVGAAQVDDSLLAGVSGGTSIGDITLTNQNLTATATDNQINAGTVVSGGVTFGANAFTGFNGIGNFVVNTGNNNILQGSLSVTVAPGLP
jgi:hypothetical protein